MATIEPVGVAGEAHAHLDLLPTADIAVPGWRGLEDGQLSFDDLLWAEPGTARNEQVRGAADAPVADGGPGAIRADPRPGGVLHADGGRPGGTDRRAGASDRGARPARRGLFGEGGAA